MSKSKEESEPAPASSPSSISEVVLYEGDRKSAPIRKRRLVMLCNTIGFILVVTVVVTSLSLSSSEETITNGLQSNGSFWESNVTTTIEPLPSPEARYSHNRKVVAFMPISVNHDDVESFSRIDYYDEEYDEDEYSEEIEENRFGVGIKRIKHQRPASRFKNSKRKKHLPSTMSLPRIKNRAKLNYLRKKRVNYGNAKKYSDVPDLHKRPGPPYMHSYIRASTPKRRITKPRSKKKKTGGTSALIIIDKRKQTKKTTSTSTKHSKGEQTIPKIKRRRKLRPNLADLRYRRPKNEYSSSNNRHDYDSRRDRNYKPPINRPPPRHPGVRIPGVRYPSNSGSIRDIIEYMNQKPKEDPELESHAAGIYQTAQNGYFYPTGEVSNNETWMSYYTPTNARAELPTTYNAKKNYYQSVHTLPIQVPKQLDHNKYNYVYLPSPPVPKPTTAPKIKRPTHNYVPEVYDQKVNHVPKGISIHSLGYDPSHPDGPDYTEVTTLKKSSGPLSIGLDVYPIAGGNSKSSSAFSSRYGSKKQEVLLHLNLFSNSHISSKKSNPLTTTSPPRVERPAQKPYLPTSYYYFSTPGSHHGDKRFHPAQSSSLVETEVRDPGSYNRADDETHAEDILKYLASSINEGNLRIGNHEIQISTNLQNSSSSSNLLDKDRLLNYLNHRLDDNPDEEIVTRRRETLEQETHYEDEREDSKPYDNALSTTSIVETYEAPRSKEVIPISTSPPLFENDDDDEKSNEDFEYYYQYYYDYVYPEELEKHTNGSTTNKKQ